MEVFRPGGTWGFPTGGGAIVRWDYVLHSFVQFCGWRSAICESETLVRLVRRRPCDFLLGRLRRFTHRSWRVYRTGREEKRGCFFFVRRVCSLISPSLYVDRSFLIAAERGCRRAATVRTKSQSERKISCAAVVVVVEMRFGSELITRRNAVQIFFLCEIVPNK